MRDSSQANKLNYIIDVTANSKLIQHERGIFTSPELKFNIQLNKINIHIQKNQMQEIIQLLEFFSLYNKILDEHKLKLIFYVINNFFLNIILNHFY